MRKTTLLGAIAGVLLTMTDGRTGVFSLSVPNVEATYNYSFSAGAFTDL